jgi:HEAT repeat protein
VTALGPRAAEALPELDALFARPDPDERVLRAVAVALESLGPAAERTTLAGLRSPSATVRAQSACVLGSLGGDAVSRNLDAVAAAADDPVPRVRSAAIDALRRGEARSRAALPAIAARFADPDLAVRLAAVGAVKDVGADAATARALLPLAASDASLDVRRDALEAMGTVAAADAPIVKGALDAALRDPDEGVRAAARRALARLESR